MKTKINVASICSFCSAPSQEVRVRFAPSPTGFLHLGGLRTVLYNFLFARAHEGKLILRIEDTDRTRLVPGAVEQLVEDLKWLNIEPDESENNGGSYGPYVQSLRAEIYKKEAQKLISSGAAYYCFCTEKRLDLIRKHAVRNHQVPKYDNHCRALSESEVEDKIRSGLNKCVRFKLTTPELFRDVVYGPVMHAVDEIEGDPVILKTDGLPTYHLASVVDDVKMRISHVIRGVEWLQSTNKHLMIYSALGHSPPTFAHLPLLLNADGSKISKRQGALAVHSLRKQGILPRALINFVVQAGGGFKPKPSANASLDELASKFNLGEVTPSSGRLAMDLLPDFNRRELQRHMQSDNHFKALVEDVKNRARKTFPDGQALDLDDDHIKHILKWCIPRITGLDDLFHNDLKFLWLPPDTEALAGVNRDIIRSLMDELKSQDFSSISLKTFLKSFSQSTKFPFRDLMGNIRTSVSGLKEGPGVVEMMTLLGKETTLRRIEKACTENKGNNL